MINLQTVIGQIDPAEIFAFIEGLSYPITKEDVVEKAREQGIDETVVHDINTAAEEAFQNAGELIRVLQRNDYLAHMMD